MEAIIGKDFDYGDSIPNLDNLKIDGDGNFDQIWTNLRGLGKYTDVTWEGPKMGRNYFLPAGKCTGGKDDNKTKYSFFRNIPAGTTSLGKKFKGILPGMMEDFGDLNIIHLLKPLFTSADESSLSDYDQETESNCKKIKRKEMECRYGRFKGAKKQRGGGYCKSKCVKRRVAKTYNECRDIKSGTFCSSKDEKRVKKLCSGISEGFKNMKDNNTISKIIIIIMILLFTYLAMRRISRL